MGDFYQNGVITTLHHLGSRNLEDLENEIQLHSKVRPVTLILPCLFSELEGKAMPVIIDELKKVKYLDQIIIGLDSASAIEFKYAREFFNQLPQNHSILWNDGPGIRHLIKMFEDKDLYPGERGKGRNVWLCIGYFLASNIGKAIALHDCDIVTYKRDMLARLVYPIVNPNFPYRFCKGYYYRADNQKLNGRVSRLFVTPLLRALKRVFGYIPLIEYLDSFRYPTSGEFSMLSDIARNIRLQGDWGLEIGVLFEIHRNIAIGRICQSDIADAYDHKHQRISEENPETGLNRMSFEICKTVFNKLAAEGQVFTRETIKTIKSTYFRIALDIVEMYYSDSLINGLNLDRHLEESTVELFARNIIRAGEEYQDKALEINLLPAWKRVISALPDIQEKFVEVVEQDNK